MNRSTLHTAATNSDSRCVDFIAMAERELSAFFNAVSQLFGREQAERSAEDWLHELSQIDSLPSSIREWRLITAKVSSRLADRMSASALLTGSQLV